MTKTLLSEEEIAKDANKPPFPNTSAPTAIQETQPVQMPVELPPKKLTTAQIREQIEEVQDLYKTVMKPDIHYGIIPGCGDKPTLLKSGGELLILMFQLSPKIKELQKVNLPNEHREYEMTISLYHKHTGELWGEGTGMCTTMETKYRWRNLSRKCPECGKTSIIKGKAEYGGGWLCWKKKEGCGFKFKDDDKRITSQTVSRIENEDIADTYNTVKKMCKKRAIADAVLTVTGVSNIFTQDIEEGHIRNEKAPENVTPKEDPKKNSKPAPEKEKEQDPKDDPFAEKKKKHAILHGLLNQLGAKTIADVKNMTGIESVSSCEVMELNEIQKRLEHQVGLMKSGKQEPAKKEGEKTDEIPL